MPDQFHHRHFVAPSEIDAQGHANNVAYIEWMQAAAIGHSSAQGWPMERYRAAGWSWVVRTHHIEYRRPAFAGDELIVKTWVASMQKYVSVRKFEIVRRDAPTVLLARAETHWAFVNLATGRLLAIPEEVSRSFVVVAEDSEILDQV